MPDVDIELPYGPDPPPRSRGGQPGNRNARKYGFYSRRGLAVDLADIERHSFDGLSEEIAILRVFIRRLASRGAGDAAPQQEIDRMRVVCLAMVTLTRLLRTEVALTDDSETRNAFGQVLSDMVRELGYIDEQPS